MDLEKDVLDDAVSFMRDHEEIFRQGLLAGETDFQSLPYDDNGEFHSHAVDIAYTLTDAAYIVENCKELEEDRGMWHGLDPGDALRAQAQYSYGNDVRVELERLYEELFEKFEETVSDIEARKAELDDTDDADLTPEESEERAKLAKADIDEMAADQAWGWFTDTNTDTVEPCAKGSDDEKFAIRRWLRLNDGAGMRSGYPLGESYIDSRCGVGYGMPEVKDYVDYDHYVKRRVPHLRGKYRGDVEGYFKEAFGELVT